MEFVVIDSYIDSLIKNSTQEIPVWNIEKAQAGKKSGWDYIDGCMIMALLEIYSTTNDRKYLEFADWYEDYRIHDDGTIDGYEKDDYNIDEINGGKNLITLYKLTGKEKYKKAAAKLEEQMKTHPRTAEGNFWHKKIYPNQVWLDGLYMGLPFLMEYQKEFESDGEWEEDIYHQFFNVYEIMRNKNNGLYYHCYDSSRKMFWADKVTGLSKNFWLRSIGWYAMAMLDTLNKAVKKDTTNWNALKHNFIELMNAVLLFQDESGMWYQVPDMKGRGKNYLETSGSAILAYSLLKGVRTGILDRSYIVPGKKAFEGICSKYLVTENNRMSLGGICLVAGLGPESKPNRDGTFEYYMSEPIVKDDAKGVGPFILAYNEYRLLK